MALPTINGTATVWPPKKGEPFELKYNQSGTAYLSVNFSWQKSKKLPDGSFENIDRFSIRSVLFGDTAERVYEGLQPGDKFDVVIEAGTNEWTDNEGRKHYDPSGVVKAIGDAYPRKNAGYSNGGAYG